MTPAGTSFDKSGEAAGLGGTGPVTSRSTAMFCSSTGACSIRIRTAKLGVRPQ
jgi:hypothetical protein